MKNEVNRCVHVTDTHTFVRELLYLYMGSLEVLNSCSLEVVREGGGRKESVGRSWRKGKRLKFNPKSTPLICDKCIKLTSGILLVRVDKKPIAFCRLFRVFY